MYNNTELSVLIMNDCNLCDIGMEAMFSLMWKPYKLKEIYLDQNSITDLGFKFIIDAIQNQFI